MNNSEINFITSRLTFGDFNEEENPPSLQTVNDETKLPNIIKPLWEIVINQARESYLQERTRFSGQASPFKNNTTFKTYLGTYGPYKNIIVKEALKDNPEANKELEILPLVVDHPNMQQIRDCGTADDKIYIAVVNCGHSIQSFLDRIHPDAFPSIYKQLIKGFAYLAKKGILHRDVNCSNIYLTSFEKDAKLRIGGFKHSLNLNRSDQAVQKKLDLPAERLVYHYHGYGDNNYCYQKELFFIGCVMNSVLNGNDLRSTDGNVVRPSAPKNKSYEIRHVLHLNKVMMSPDLEEANVYLDAPLLSHHLFWCSSKVYMFIESCYDYIEGVRYMSDRQEWAIHLKELNASLEEDHDHLFNDSWPEKWLHLFASATICRLLRSKGKFNFGTVYGLLAAVCCRGGYNYEDIPQVRLLFEAPLHTYIEKWLRIFPGLLSHLVRWALKNRLHQEKNFLFEFEKPFHGFWQIVSEVDINDYAPQAAW